MSHIYRETDPNSPPSTPRWVKVFGVIFIVLVLLFIVLHLTGNSLGNLHGLTLPTEIGVCSRMIMSPGLRKAALTAHVITSVGWFGAVASFLVLAIVGLTSQDAQLVRAVYLAMEVTTFTAIVPLAIAALLTGIVSSLGTKWGLFRYYWVVVKLLITVLSTIVLLVHLQPIRHLARIAANTTVSNVDARLQLQMVVASAATLIVLLVLTALSVYKPQGMTPYGWRKQQQRTNLPAEHASLS